MNNAKHKDFDIRYEYIASEEAEIRLQRVFEMIFEKIVKAEGYSKTNQNYLQTVD